VAGEIAIDTKTDRIERYISDRLKAAKRYGASSLTIKSGDIGKELGLSDRMPMICSAMRKLQTPSDIVVEIPPKGNGSRLIIKYILISCYL
jgi:hypothetical protein